MPLDDAWPQCKLAQVFMNKFGNKTQVLKIDQ